MEMRFDTYYDYKDLTQILRSLAEGHPEFVRLESIGQSYEQRDIWLATVTNFEAGEPHEKPGFWADGNIHAGEISGSTACLYLLNHLVSEYGEQQDVTRCLDTRTFYICPRLNPDGAELILADSPKLIRSSTRPYPYDEDPVHGLVEEDIDGDGRLLMMRIPDPNGAWKRCEENPRLLVRREPAETGGEYYRVLPEGRIENYDGVLIPAAPMKEGLDLNRNYPVNWRQEYETSGAGPYPTSEPEVRAAVQFIVSHPNITGGAGFHTWSGVLVRPYSDQPDENLPPEDLWTYEKIGQKGTEMTGYPSVSCYHELRYHPRRVRTGTFSDWLYEHRGVFGWTPEIWDPQRQAGIEDPFDFEWYREHPLEDELKLIEWSDKALGGKGFVDWYAFEHPQLGSIELGGWNYIYAFRNPPPEFLESEIAPFADWLVWHLLISPLLEIYEASARPLGRDSYRVRLVVHNTGWLPSYVTKRALERELVRGVICEIELPEGASLETGELREDLGQLEGRAYKPSAPGLFDPLDFTDTRAKVEWIVHAPHKGAVRLIARHERAGAVVTEVILE
jgi:murein tripeptide amidase MpaA